MADRRELASVALERTRMPMVITDPRQAGNPIVLANRAFLDLTGYSAEEVIGRNCRILQGEDTDDNSVAEVGQMIREQRHGVVEVLNYRKDGSAFWNQLCLSPIHDDEGRLIYYFGSQFDVTERRNAQDLEAAQLRLLREVDHRAMNVLAIVEGIVRLSRADDAGQYAAAVQSRVQALSKAHTQLALGGWRGVSLGELIKIQVEPFGDERVVMTGPDVSVAPHIVQSLALIIHELIANAARHGALASPSGAVRIDWRDEPGDGRLAFSWNESGAPAPARGSPDGFGFKMLKAIVERQLGGELTRNWNDDGLDTLMRIPLSGLHAA